VGRFIHKREKSKQLCMPPAAQCSLLTDFLIGMTKITGIHPGTKDEYAFSWNQLFRRWTGTPGLYQVAFKRVSTDAS
jgi:hypothetical protein